MKLIADRGWELAHAPFSDNDVSATKRRKRPAYEQAMAMVKGRRHDVLVVAHMDRLYRRAAELETIIPVVEQTGMLVVSTDGAYDLSTANGRMVARMLCAASQGEVETKARSNKDANVQAASNGERNKSGCRPFGYCADRFTPMDPGVPLALVHGTAKNPCPTMDGPGWPSTDPWQEMTARVPETVYDADGRVTATASEADAIRDALSRSCGAVRSPALSGSGARGLRPPLAPFGPLAEQNPWNSHTVKRIFTNPHIAGLRAYRNGEIVAAGSWAALVGKGMGGSPGHPRQPGPRFAPMAACRSWEGSRSAGVAGRSSGPPGGLRHVQVRRVRERGAAATGPHVAAKAEPIDQYVSDVVIDTMGLPDAADLFATTRTRSISSR